MEHTVIIFLTDLPLWSLKKGMGAPSFYKTIQSYIDNHATVYLITTNYGDGEKELLDSQHLFIINKAPYERFMMIPKVGYLANLVRHYVFTRKSKQIIHQIIKKESNKNFLLYAYEIFGVKAAKKMSVKMSVPFVSRFQGTILCGRKQNIIDKIRFPLHYQALKTTSDLMIMTDDGTQGLKIVKELGNPMENIVFWKNGLDLLEKDYNDICNFNKIEFRNSFGIQENDFVLLTVSRLAEWKRVDRAIRIISDEKLAECSIKLVIVGDGSCRHSLEQLCKDLRVSDKVIFVGSQLQKEVYQFMLMADLFLSLYDISNVGNPLLESMILGLPAITLDVGDTNTIISNGNNGLLVQPDKQAELPELILDLISDKEKRKELGRCARKYALNHFYTWKKRMDMEHREIDKLIGHSSRRENVSKNY